MAVEIDIPRFEASRREGLIHERLSVLDEIAQHEAVLAKLYPLRDALTTEIVRTITQPRYAPPEIERRWDKNGRTR